MICDALFSFDFFRARRNNTLASLCVAGIIVFGSLDSVLVVTVATLDFQFPVPFKFSSLAHDIAYTWCFGLFPIPVIKF